MKKNNLILCVSLISLLLISSCMSKNSKQVEDVISQPSRKSLWTDSLKTNFIAKNSKTDFDKFIFRELILKYEFDKTLSDLKQFVKTSEFKDFKNSKIKTYVVNVDNLAGKSKNAIKAMLGSPNYKNKINPSNTPCPCDQYNYLEDLVEIVFINEKADWITVNNTSSYITVQNSASYQSVNRFDDYTYVKVKTK